MFVCVDCVNVMSGMLVNAPSQMFLTAKNHPEAHAGLTIPSEGLSSLCTVIESEYRLVAEHYIHMHDTRKNIITCILKKLSQCDAQNGGALPGLRSI